MRAATRTGFVFVGAHVGPDKLDVSVGNQFQPRVVPSNPQRPQYQQSLLALAKNLEALIASATESAEIEFWRRQLARLKGFGE